MRRPLFAAGLFALASLFLCFILSKTALILTVGAVFFAAFVLTLTRRRALLPYALAAAVVLAAFAGLYTARYALRVAPSLTLCGKTAVLEGELDDFPSRTAEGWRYTLRNCAVNGSGTGLRVCVYTRTPLDCAPGDGVRFETARFFDAPPETLSAHTLSGGVWLRAAGYGRTSLRRSASPSLRDRIAVLRRGTQERLSAALLPLHAEISAALLTGDGDALPAAFRTKLRTAGASHLFAVSGMHLTLWTGAIFFALRRLAGLRRTADAAAAGFIAFYAVFTGLSPSVLRAGLMLLAVFLGRGFRRYADPLNSLGLAALVLLACNPFLAGNVSFLLSVSAVAGICILYPVFAVSVRGRETPAVRLRRTAAGLPNGILLSLCVLLFTVPASAFFFSSVSLLSPLSSVLLALPAEGVMASSAAAALTAGLPAVSGPCFRLCEFCCAAMDRILTALSSLDFALCPADLRVVSAWYGCTLALVAAVWLRTKKNARAAVCALLLSAACALTAAGVGTALRLGEKTLLLPPAGSTTAAAVALNGTAAVQIGTGEDPVQAAAVSDYLLSQGVTAAPTVLLPDGAAAEAGRFGSNYRVRSVFCTEETRKFFPDAGIGCCAPAFSLTLEGGIGFRLLRWDGGSAGILTADGRRAVFLFSAAVSTADAPDEARSGALLVCRGAVPPGIDPSAFGQIAVMTDKPADALRLPANARTTGDGGLRFDLTEFRFF